MPTPMAREKLTKEAMASLLADWRRTHGPRPSDDPRLLVCPLECDAKQPGFTCPAHCTNASCPTRRRDQPLAQWMRHLMRVIEPLMPPHPPPLPLPAAAAAAASSSAGGLGGRLVFRPLLLITTTYPHVEQLLRLRHCVRVLAGEPALLWIVVEDAAERTPAVATLLARSGIEHVHLAHGPTRRNGNAQRNAALKLIRDRKLEGVVYNLDDDNGYHPRLWNELRALRPRRVGVLAVRRGVFPPPRCDGRFLPLINRQRRTLKIERPVYDNVTGRFARFDAGWCRRRSWMTRRYGPRAFCVDMAGFAFDAALLQVIAC